MPTFSRNMLLALLLALIAASSTLAQSDGDPDAVTEDNIIYGGIVTDTITDEAFFDHWYFQAEAGDVIQVVMQGDDGLVPLVGILNASRELVARSDVNPDGTELATPAPGGSAALQFSIPASGEYIIIATRQGNADGLSTGGYQLGLRKMDVTERPNDLAPVTFRCGEAIVTSAVILEIVPSPLVSHLRVTVFGLDGFQPAIDISATMIDMPEGFNDCNGNADGMIGDGITLPDGTTFTIGIDSDESDYYGGAAAAAQITLGSIVANMGTVQTIIASADGLPGRYVAVVEGLMLDPSVEDQPVQVRLGPASQTSDLLVYMLAGENRLDPFMEIPEPAMLAETNSVLACDDLGLRECSSVAALDDFTVDFPDEGKTIAADRFDAGLYLNPASTDPIEISLQSRTRRADGEFVLILMGSLPEASD